jgi:hypothetical protein
VTRSFRSALPLACLLLALGGAGTAYADDTPADDFTGETADAIYTPASAETCSDPEVAPLLSSFKDDDLYFTAPGGSFEGGTDGWQLEGGAAVSDGSNLLDVLGGDRSLSLPVGATATSPEFCVDERYPKFRLSTAQLGDKGNAKVRVSVIYPGLEKNVRHAKDVDAQRGRWQLSAKIDLKPQYGMKKRGWRLVALRFEVPKGEASADVRVDDVVVDPRARF